MFRNKKGNAGDKVMFIVFISLMILSGIGIMGGMFIFFGDGLDYRQIHADVLGNKIKNCFVEKVVSSDDVKDGSFFDECDLNEDILLKKFTLRITEMNGDERLISFGNAESCLIEGGKGNKKFPRCNVFGVENFHGKFEIIAGSRQKRWFGDE